MSDELPESPESDPEARRQTIILLAVLIEGGLLAGSSLLGWMLDRPPLRFFTWDLQAVLWGVVATLPLLVLFFLFSRFPVGPLQRIQRFSDEVMRPLLAPCSVIDLLGISVLAGLGEEMFFRGVIQEAFAGWLSVWVGILISSVMFGLMHLITVTYAVLAAFMGAYLGWVWLYADHNLLVIVITHALYDFIILLWLLHGPGAAEALEALYSRESEEKADKPPS